MMSDTEAMSSPAAESGAEGLELVLDTLFTGPMLPASLLACVCLMYLVVALIGLADLGGDGGAAVDLSPEAPDLDFGLDLDPGAGPEAGLDLDASVEPAGGGEAIPADWWGGIGAATVRAVHLDRVPLMIWLSTFSLVFWLVSYVLWMEFDARRYPPTVWPSIWLTLRNVVLAAVGTRWLTTPLHRLLRPARRYDASTLLGQTAVVDTLQVDERYGRVCYRTETAPLLLNVQTRGEIIKKGAIVELVDYDTSTRVYTVARVPSEPPKEGLGGTIASE